MIAAAGLSSDSSVTVVASMLVSPLMGPILCVTFGAAIQKREMVTRGIRNEAYGMLICVVVGMIAGVAIGPFYGPGGFEGGSFDDPLKSDEVDSRGDIYALIPGFFVAIPSGMGVALGMTAGGINALVGVAISAALLPPMVNVGICFSLGLWYSVYDEPEEANTWFEKSGCSLLLYLTNIICIFVMAMLVFKLKNISKSSMVERKVVRWNESVEQIFIDGGTNFWCCCNRKRNSHIGMNSSDSDVGIGLLDNCEMEITSKSNALSSAGVYDMFDDDIVDARPDHADTLGALPPLPFTSESSLLFTDESESKTLNDQADTTTL